MIERFRKPNEQKQNLFLIMPWRENALLKKERFRKPNEQKQNLFLIMPWRENALLKKEL